MLSYQHLYHAGNLADVHKHALLAFALDYLTRKDKPLSYIETHAGRGLYDLSAAEALKTGEAAQGIARLSQAFPASHPYARVLAAVRATNGASAYPGSPLVASHLLRDTDTITLAELHPQERAALGVAPGMWRARVRAEDGFAMAMSLAPPTPRRGMILIDPSYEVKADYDAIPGFIAKLARAWNVGVVMLWYPVLTSGAHVPMLDALCAAHPGGLRYEVRFPPARTGHKMIGSGVFVLNPPYGMDDEARRLDAIFARLARR
ncbi:23S rRNA (adenine(2030)-N(6))-methyltransferase RlmJ [Anianabacter salinae]|uniref:23S rRNA (adenine(2030)-N(6))-methyltransferase RlmJ n=1 Tax=Anianabacter salinae TaxID=2851023 RepID=UPI00225E6B93|nr:23S rRNA (adenine(2030)-N(6))-methyltransferase RlmJ [Anianabacter salinae]MBV0912593.1 23S rRNA (adenine(2030)-N(6))-methyltransferase RlmJ [Anianabacter salinae]